MRKLKLLMMVLAMTLLLATPAVAQVFGDDNAVANLSGFVAIDSTFTTNVDNNTNNCTLAVCQGGIDTVPVVF